MGHRSVCNKQLFQFISFLPFPRALERLSTVCREINLANRLQQLPLSSHGCTVRSKSSPLTSLEGPNMTSWVTYFGCSEDFWRTHLGLISCALLNSATGLQIGIRQASAIGKRRSKLPSLHSLSFSEMTLAKTASNLWLLICRCYSLSLRRDKDNCITMSVLHINMYIIAVPPLPAKW